MLNKILGFLLLTAFSVSEVSAQQIDTSKLIGLNYLGQSPYDSIKIIDPSLYKEDFIIFKNALEQIHPSLYLFKGKKIINKLFDSCYLTLNQSTTETKFYLILKFIMSSIEDGHFYCGPSKDFRKYYDESAKVFPLYLKFIENKAYIICSNNGSLQPETQILSINNVPINNIRKELFRYIVSDGAIQTKKYWILSNNFWFYYSVVYGEQMVFKVNYKTKDGKIDTVTLNSDIKRNIDCRPEVKQINYLQLAFETNNIALLTIKTFNNYELNKSKEDFKNFLNSTFKELQDKQVGKLIIDLRGNGGGKDEYGSLLYSYLTDKEFPYYASLETISQKLAKNIHPNLQVQKPSEKNFKGQVIFLIDGLSFSTTAEFCSIAKSNNRGKFIGEETGGGYYGNTSGNSVDTVLPNTKITISIPITKYILAVKRGKYKDRGIIPDYTVVPNINDIIKNKDVQLNFALKIMAHK
jgi:hypothetical protein